MAWLYVLFAAIVEVFWVIGLKYSDSLLEWIGTIIAIVLSFYFVINACEKLPAGTVYAVFTGIGAAAIVMIDFLLFGADFSLAKVLFIGLIILGVIGIKITTPDDDNQEKTVEEGENKMAWIYLVIASFGEIFGVMSINLYLRKKTIGWLSMIVLTFGSGFLFLSLAMRDIRLGTAYAVWTGLGAAGAVLMGIIFFKEAAGWKRILFLSFIIDGAVGLRVLE